MSLSPWICLLCLLAADPNSDWGGPTAEQPPAPRRDWDFDGFDAPPAHAAEDEAPANLAPAGPPAPLGPPANRLGNNPIRAHEASDGGEFRRFDDESAPPRTLRAAGDGDFAPPPARQPRAEFAPYERAAAGEAAPFAHPDAPETRLGEANSPGGRWIANVMQARERAELAGRRVPLADVLGRIRARNNRLAAVAAYWELALCEARYHLAAADSDFLASLAEPPSEIEQTALRAALAQSRAARHRAQANLMRAQRRLNEFYPVAPPDADAAGWPLAADLPVAGGYRSEFERLFAHRSAPAILAQLHAALPIHRAAVEEHLNAVEEYNQLLAQWQGAYANGEGPLTVIVETMERRNAAREELLAAIEDYNGTIAEYALGVAEQVGPEANDAIRTASMLTHVAAPTPAFVAEAMPASATAPALVSPAGSWEQYPPPQYQQPQYQQPAGEMRSILVEPARQIPNEPHIPFDETPGLRRLQE